MMPDMDGIKLCMKIREKTNMPVIIEEKRKIFLD